MEVPLNKVNTGVDEHAALIDKRGRKHLTSTLNTHSKIYEAIADLQQTFGLNYSSNMALPFFDLLEVSRASVYQSLVDSSKSRLEDVLQNASQTKLLEMLSATFRFITVKDLKSIPIGVIKRLQKVPEKYLKALPNGIPEELPLSVRRQVWLVEPSHFIKLVSEFGDTWAKAATANDSSSASHAIDDIRNVIGTSAVLFKAFGRICVEKVLTDRNLQWAELLRRVLIEMGKDKIPALGKVRDVALQIDQSIREGKMSDKAIQNLVDYVRDVARAAEASRAQAPAATVPVAAVPSSAVSTQRVRTPAASDLRQSLHKQIKNAIKCLGSLDVNSIFKKPAVNFFPDAEGKREYLSIIAHPMDLSTMQKKAASYSSVEEFESDVKLMLANCMTFNPDEEFRGIARSLWNGWLKKRKVAFQDSAESLPPPPSPPRPPPAHDDDDDEMEEEEKTFDPPVLKIKTKPSARPSPSGGKDNEPVGLIKIKKSVQNNNNGDDLSGLIKIKKPVQSTSNGDDLSGLIKTKKPVQSTSNGDDLSGLIKVKKPIEDKKPQASEVVREEEKRIGIISESAKNATFSSAATPASEAERKVPDEISVSEEALPSVLTNAWNFISSRDTEALFVRPVVELVPDIAKQYRKEIKHPMDLSTIKNKIDGFVYSSVDEFESDVLLMLSNCKKFNKGNQYICDIATKLGKSWKSQRKEIMKGKEVPAPSAHAPLVEEDRQRPVLRALTAEEKAISEELDDIDTSMENALLFVSEQDFEGIFANPVTDTIAPGYSSEIKRPMDLSTMQSLLARYDSLDKFETDLKRIFENCLIYNEPRRNYEYSDWAVDLWNIYLENRSRVLRGEEIQEETSLMKKRKRATEEVEEEEEEVAEDGDSDEDEERYKPRRSSKRSRGIEEVPTRGGRAARNGGASYRSMEESDGDDWDEEEDDDDDEREVFGEEDEGEEETGKKKPSKSSSSSSRGSSRKSEGGLSNREKIMKASRSSHSGSSAKKKPPKADPKHFPKPPMLHTIAVNSGSLPAAAQSGAVGMSNGRHQRPAPPPSAGTQSQTVLDGMGQEAQMWANIILRDKRLQILIRHYLADQLTRLCRDMVLPCDDENSTNALGLCQYGLHFQKRVAEVNDKVLQRVVLPSVMFHYLDHQQEAAGTGVEEGGMKASAGDFSLDAIIPEDFLRFDKDLLGIFVKDVLSDMMAQVL